MAEFIADPHTLCRSCRGSGEELADSGNTTACYYCGGTGRKSIRLDDPPEGYIPEDNSHLKPIKNRKALSQQPGTVNWKAVFPNMWR